METAFPQSTGMPDADASGSAEALVVDHVQDRVHDPDRDSDDERGHATDDGGPATATLADPRSIDDIEQLLNGVETALSRLDDGVYGVCASCGSPITDERLATSPTTTRCSTCVSGGHEG
jgi:RNA polymerase-binding transcription factor